MTTPLHGPPHPADGTRARSPLRAATGPASPDEALVARIRLGDPAAFDAVFRAHYQPLCAFACSYVRSPELAEEVVEDTFCAIWEKRAEWQLHERLKPYLYNAVRNRALNVVAHGAVEQQWRSGAATGAHASGMGEAPRPVDQQVEAAALRDALARAIAALPPRCRDVYVMVRQHGLSYADVAVVMGTTTKTVENQLVRAMKTLRAALIAWRP